jgi:hypothetical protein
MLCTKSVPFLYAVSDWSVWIKKEVVHLGLLEQLSAFLVDAFGNCSSKLMSKAQELSMNIGNISNAP